MQLLDLNAAGLQATVRDGICTSGTLLHAAGPCMRVVVVVVVLHVVHVIGLPMSGSCVAHHVWPLCGPCVAHHVWPLCGPSCVAPVWPIMCGPCVAHHVWPMCGPCVTHV